jgi:DNA repair exonuclease SbcCD ATPase subunit
MDWVIFGNDASVIGDAGYRFMKTWKMAHQKHSDVTEVEAEFYWDDDDLSICRNKASGVTIEKSGNKIDDDPADFLGLTRRDYRSAIHLHQQVTNKILAETPKDRRAIFDRLLGVGQIQDVIDELDNWASYQGSKELKVRLDQAVAKKRSQVAGLRDDIDELLIDAPFAESECTEEEAQSRCESIMADLSGFAEGSETLQMPKDVEWDTKDKRDEFESAIEKTIQKFRREHSTRQKLDTLKGLLGRLPNKGAAKRAEAKSQKVRNREDDDQYRYGRPADVEKADVDAHISDLEDSKDDIEGDIEELKGKLQQKNKHAAVVSSAETFIDDTDSLDNCPVCGTDATLDQVKRHLEEASDVFDAETEELKERIDKLNEDLGQNRKKLKRAKNDRDELEDAEDKLAGMAEDLEGLVTDIEEEFELETLPTFEVGDDVVLSKMIERVKDVLDEAIADTEDSVEDRDDTLNDIKSRLDEMSTMNDALQKKSAIDNSQNYGEMDGFRGADAIITELAQEELRLATLAVAVMEAKNAFIKERLSAANDTVGEIFSTITGRTSYPDVRVRDDLDVVAKDPESEGSLDVRSIFNQGDLNAAAVSLFLGLAAEIEPTHDLGTIFLDDPIQSMDDSHIEGFARALGEIGQKRQIVVATHDGKLVDELKDIGTRTRIFEFEPYDEESGPRFKTREA